MEVTFSNMLDSAHIDFNESECGSLGGEDYMTIGKYYQHLLYKATYLHISYYHQGRYTQSNRNTEVLVNTF